MDYRGLGFVVVVGVLVGLARVWWSECSAAVATGEQPISRQQVAGFVQFWRPSCRGPAQTLRVCAKAALQHNTTMNAVFSVYRDESGAVSGLHLLLCCLSRCSWLDVLMHVSSLLGPCALAMHKHVM